MKKKGSLSLSINAIVILVLAITMLGLGLAFTKGMFGKLSSKLSVPEPDIPATAEDPVVLPVEELTITKNKQFIFSVNFYNDGFGSDSVRGKLACEAVEGGAAGALSICSAPQPVPPGDDKGFKFIVDSVTQSSTRVCTLGFSTAAALACGVGDTNFPDTAVTKQIVVIVR